MTTSTNKVVPRRPTRVFRNRQEAGRVLAGLLAHYRRDPSVLVLGLARGGMPVAWEVAAALEVPLDAMVVRKLGAPGFEELAMGALASGGRVVLNDDIVRGLHITPEQLSQVAEREGRELARREAVYRDERPPLDVGGRTVILVDDGLATGASMMAAVEAVRAGEPAAIIVAVPAAAESTCRELGALVEDLVCATMPTPFRSVGESFWDFAQVDDGEVRRLLAAPTTGVRHGAAVRTPAEAISAVAIAAPQGVPSREVLSELIGDARVVLIGEASHGTHEFYAARAEITKWLITERGFSGVAAEADWPDAYRVNRYVRGLGTDTTAEESLRGFERFPAWMWRNTVVRDFVDWLHARNQRLEPSQQAGFYGLDLYSLHRSMQDVIGYLEQIDPPAAARARHRYGCFDHMCADDDGQAYGHAAAFGAGESCEREVIAQLVDTHRSSIKYLRRDGISALDEAFCAERNAWTVRNAEAYYRGMFASRASSWNMRDEHMAHTLHALLEHHGRSGASGRIVVWAHNSHVGDARATEVAADGQLTVGQLARERYGDACKLIGFSTYTGAVTAASSWGGQAEHKAVRPALSGSVEELLHDAGGDRHPIFVGSQACRADRHGAAEAWQTVRLGRAIGVIYLPQTERQSHYFHVRPADQFDAMIHIGRTHALEPLEPTSLWIAGQTPETYPSGL